MGVARFGPAGSIGDIGVKQMQSCWKRLIRDTSSLRVQFIQGDFDHVYRWQKHNIFLFNLFYSKYLQLFRKKWRLRSVKALFFCNFSKLLPTAYWSCRKILLLRWPRNLATAKGCKNVQPSQQQLIWAADAKIFAKCPRRSRQNLEQNKTSS